MAVHYGYTRRSHVFGGKQRTQPGIPPDPPDDHTPGAQESAQSGPWNSTSTWVDGNVPGAGDTATIKAGHIVTTNLNVTVGDESATPAVTIEATGQLKQTGGIFHVEGDFLCSASDSVISHLINGGIFEFGNGGYEYTQPAQTTGVSPSAQFLGTSLSRITIRTEAGGTNAIFRGTGASRFCLLAAQYCDFLRLGDASNDWIRPSVIGASTFTLDHCTVDNCGSINCNSVNLGATAAFRLSNVKFTNSLQSVPLSYVSYGAMTAGGIRLFEGVYFDKSPNLYAPRDTTFLRVVFNSRWVTTSADGYGWEGMDNCLIRLTTNDLNINGDVTNCYVLYDNDARTNQHMLQAGTYPLTTYAVTGNVFEFTGSDAVGDCITMGEPGSGPVLVDMQYNVFLPNSAGECSGTPFSSLGNANLSLKFNHNTYLVGSQGAAIQETYTGRTGMVQEFKSNIAWDTSARGYMIYDSGTDDVVVDCVSAAALDYNCTHNVLTGSNGVGMNGLQFSSGTPQAHGVSADPDFVEPERNIAQWDLALGGAGTVAAAMARLAVDPGLVPTLVSYVKAGFAPTNDALQGTAHDGTDMGAVAVVPSGTGPPDEGDPDPEPEPNPVQPVPRKDEWYTRLKPFNTALKQWYVDYNHPPIPAGYDPQGYYDGQRGAQYLEDYWDGEESTWQGLQDEVDAGYRVYYVDANGGAIPTHRAFPEGMYERYIRRGHTAARTSLLSLYNAAYVSSNAANEDLSQTIYGREVGYGLGVHVQSGRPLLGYTLTSAQTARRGQLYQWSLTHLQKWAAVDVQYCRPFMMGLVCKSLIDYHTHVTEDPLIVTRMSAALDYIWDTCWKETAGAWGRAQAFTYSDRPSSQIVPASHAASGMDQVTQPDLNMLVCPAFGWLYKMTGLIKWRERGDKIFTGGIPIYNGNVHNGGSYLGQPNQYVSGKQLNQQLYWGPKYFLYAENGTVTEPPVDPIEPDEETPPAPSGLTNALYLNAGDASTLLDGAGVAAAYGAGVSQWSDKSSFTRHFLQATASARPTRASATNGSATFDVVRFDASDDRLIGNSLSTSIASGVGCLVVAISGKITTQATTMGMCTIYTSTAGNPRARCSLLADAQWAAEARRLDTESGSSCFSGPSVTYTTNTWGVLCGCSTIQPERSVSFLIRHSKPRAHCSVAVSQVSMPQPLAEYLSAPTLPQMVSQPKI